MADDLPTFQTPRLTVRPRRLEDLEACCEFQRKPPTYSDLKPPGVLI
jgi:hypothetical protein